MRQLQWCYDTSLNLQALLLALLTIGMALCSSPVAASQIKILPYGKVRPTYRVQCSSEIPNDAASEQLSNMTVVWRDAEGHAIGESPVIFAPDEPSISAEMTVQYAGASAQFSCAFKRPGGSALTGLQFSDIYVYARSEKCESDLAYCDPGKRVCRQAKCVCQQGEHLFDGAQCVPGYTEPLPCPAVSLKDGDQCTGALRKIAKRKPYTQCRQRKNRTLLERVKLLVPTIRPRTEDFSHCPCKGATAGNIIEINGIEYCQDVEQVMCCVPLSLLTDSHDFSFVWFTLISISIFIGLVLIAAFVLMVCKSRQQLQAQHRAQLRAIALQQQHNDEAHFTIYDPRVHRTVSVASDKPPSYHEVVRREASTPPPAYNMAVANLNGISPIAPGTTTTAVTTTTLNSAEPAPRTGSVQPVQRSSEAKSSHE
ncbi:uncharacterized protein LOC111266600 isoform X1 [Varroa jacobsoni]|uniref:EB domain-containing protein n=1 Tax=Varroa destructor TaxID=109461 RepID=A0A7M7JMJ6_VARDE|nr:uncharacterized protein LOC111247593 [Varroa destructor]XP_022654434.1 uncharacterized protein LOC111247593 [Varroa destructor]XP_022654435.1 uncharacterized protein LOC111247593 [Varroa destructor]XP_022699945.1 uncharacterized protein LOC111266600 isoform X1 [Varroa jacobsoni]XP_022699946.1 uncharacterized protein LOC111266600 isoform X1 [Varroa jacobsoni]